MSKLKKWLGIVLIYLILSFILGEIGLRLFLPFPKKRTRYLLTREVFQYNPSNIHFDQDLGFLNNSNLNRSFNSPEFKTKITTNSQGFRDKEESLVNPKILLLGDSFGFGWGVENNKTCASFLEELTRKSVLNMSVSGFGTIQELLLLKRLSQNRDMRGEIAIFLFCPNDLRDNINYGLSLSPEVYLDENGLIQYRRISQVDFRTWLTKVETAQFPTLYRYLYLAYGLRSMAKKIERFKKEEKVKTAVGTEEELRIFNLVIQDLKSFSQEKGIYTIFVYIPMDYVLPGNDERIFGLMKAVLDERGIPLLDLRRVLEKEDYWHYDDHWRESGHFKAARVIKKFFKENKLLE